VLRSGEADQEDDGRDQHALGGDQRSGLRGWLTVRQAKGPEHAHQARADKERATPRKLFAPAQAVHATQSVL
jgi:hypothetical protein